MAPPGNRTPTPQESQICLPFIQRQIELANPDVLVCMGGPSSQTLLGYTDGIRRTRGRWVAFNTGTREIRAIATFHPAYLLRSPWRSATPGAISSPSNRRWRRMVSRPLKTVVIIGLMFIALAAAISALDLGGDPLDNSKLFASFPTQLRTGTR